jgi:hypothetical protein
MQQATWTAPTLAVVALAGEIVCDSPFADALRHRVLEDKARLGA